MLVAQVERYGGAIQPLLNTSWAAVFGPPSPPTKITRGRAVLASVAAQHALESGGATGWSLSADGVALR